MAQINLKLDEEQLAQTDYLAKGMARTRTAYIREAIAQYNTRNERQVLARQVADAAEKCRGESSKVNAEMEAADYDFESKLESGSSR